MKTISKTFFTLLLMQAFVVSFAYAESLAFSFPNVFQEAKEMVGSALDNESKPATTTKKEVVEVELSNCEMYDETYVNIFSLDLSSHEAKQKIEKIEETIEDEAFLRDTIFGSVKNLLGLQKTEKVIFREMKKEITSAKKYYENIDTKVNDVGEYLDSTFCEEISKKEESSELKEKFTEVNDMVLDEALYRKQFAGSLKDKMSILQKEVKNAKK